MTEGDDILNVEGDLVESLQRLDVMASVAIASGGTVAVDGMNLRKLVKAASGLSAAKAAYRYQRQKLEKQEVALLRHIYFTLAISLAVHGAAVLAGLL